MPQPPGINEGLKLKKVVPRSENVREVAVAFKPVDITQLTKYQRLTQWVILPEGPFYLVWQGFILSSIYIHAILEPYMAAFQRESYELRGILYFLDVLYWIDVFLRFHLPFVRDRIHVMDLKMIADHNFKNDFILDAISMFPLEAFSPLFGKHDLVAFACLRLNRLVCAHSVFWI
jgi:hypothetical protein